MDIRNTSLEPETYFHLYNRGVNGMPVFYERKNYDFFLRQYRLYVHPFVKTYAYCLLKNHFHFLIKVRSEYELCRLKKMDQSKSLYWNVSNGFSSFFQSYTRAMNKVYDRTGPLFESPFKRIAVKEDSYVSQLIAYIHLNPVKHRLVKDFKTYTYSSYHSHLSGRSSFLETKEIIDWFSNKNAFVSFHNHHDFPSNPSEMYLE